MSSISQTLIKWARTPNYLPAKLQVHETCLAAHGLKGLQEAYQSTVHLEGVQVGTSVWHTLRAASSKTAGSLRSGGTLLQRAGSGGQFHSLPLTPPNLKAPALAAIRLPKIWCLISQWPCAQAKSLRTPALMSRTLCLTFSLKTSMSSLWQREEQPPLIWGSPQQEECCRSALTVNTLLCIAHQDYRPSRSGSRLSQTNWFTTALISSHGW